MTHNSWIEVSEGAYASNLRFFRGLVGPEVELSAVVKANAYGHGMEIIAELAVRYGADSFCVHSLDEALRLRCAGFQQDVLIMGHVPLARLDEVVDEDFRMVLFNHESLVRLAELIQEDERRVRVHLKLETGTHRQGIAEEDLDAFLDLLERQPRIVIDGVTTHFANIEDTTDHSYANYQRERFEKAVERIRAAGHQPIRHAACSAATLVVPDTHFEMVRLGVSQYGLWPSKETLLSYRMAPHPRPLSLTPSAPSQGEGRPHPSLGDQPSKVEGEEAAEPVLRPILTWKTRIGQLKQVPAGAFVGYGCTYQTTRDTRLAVLPIGYSDGYDRGLSNQGHVLVRGRRAPVRGRVCMNLIMVDVTDIPGVELEDEVVLLGRQDDQEISAGVLAELLGTIHYEVVARLSPYLTRVLVS